MSEHRSALRGAVAPSGSPRAAVSFSRVAALLAVALPVTTVLTVGTTAVRARTLASPDVVTLASAAPVPLVAEPPSGGLSWLPRSPHSTSSSGPFVTEPAADGKREIVGLASRSATEADGVYVVAFDRESLRVKWRAGPYVGGRARDGTEAYHLAVLGERAVITDARGVVHMLDVRTGDERASRTLANAPSAMCIAGKGAAARLILPLDDGWRARSPKDTTGAALFPWELNKATLALDPVTGHTSPAPQYAVCAADQYCMWKQVDGCRDLEQRKIAPSANLPVRVQEVWNAGDDRVSLGGKNGIEDSPPAAIGWTAATRAVQWEALLVTPEHPRKAKTVSRAAIDTNSFFFLYTTEAGPSRLVALATRTGERRFDMELPGSAIGTRVHEVIPGGDDVFVSMNEELVVFDARLGRLRGRLVSF